MKFSQFYNIIQKILAVEFPSYNSVIRDGWTIAKNIHVGKTAFLQKMDLCSEAEYKKQCIRDKLIMFHAHIGMNTWKSTENALSQLYNEAEKANFRIDRAGICLDRRMGLPKAMREKVPAETGPMINSEDDWRNIGNAIPIQPHMGDFMIGFPASTENTINALKAGITTIGNLSQYFSHEAPQWHDHMTTTIETVRALSIMGGVKERGTLIHSYLEDGFCALFHDCVTIAGWAFLERYIVANLLGGKLTHCIGGLTTDPVKRAGWIFALDKIYEGDCLGSMIYGDTISFSNNFTKNRGIVAEYLLWDIMAQLQCPTGHAVHPLPVTEAIRIPSAEEIFEAQSFGRLVEKTARRMKPHCNFSASFSFSEKLVSLGKDVFNHSLEGLKQAGVDIKDPLQLLYVLKKLGPALFEEMFGVGEINEKYIRKKKPVIPTDVFEMSTNVIKKHQSDFNRPLVKDVLKKHRILIASADVHEFAIQVIHQLLTDSGAKMFNLGTEKNPDEIVAEACSQKVSAILISTHNGNALDYAKQLNLELEKNNVKIPVIFGGVLNQKVENEILPIDVTDHLKKIGFFAFPKLEKGLSKMLAFKS